MARQTFRETFSSGRLHRVFLATCVFVVGPAAARGEEPDDVVRGLLSDSEQERREAENEILNARNMVVSSLIQIIREEDNRSMRPVSVDRAMRLLGELRAPEGVNVLIENIGFPILFEFGTPRGGTGGNSLIGKSPAELFPAVNALIAIGEPAIGPIIKRIAENQDSVIKRRAYIEVLRELDKKTAIRDQFVREIEKSSGRPQERLRHALGWFDNPPKSAFP
jgi:hypothetical protein